MKLKNILLIGILIPACIIAKQMGTRQDAYRGGHALPAVLPITSEVMPKIEEQSSKEAYAQNRAASLSQQIINDIFPKKETIERLVYEFKDQYPGPDKTGDTIVLYESIIKNPEIKKLITLENATRIYKFVREAINTAWDKQEELIWSR